MIESRTDQPRTSPVALRRNRVGVSPPIASVAMLISRLGAFWGGGGAKPIAHALTSRPVSAIYQKVLSDLPLLGVQLEYGTLQDAVAVNTAGIDGQRPAHTFDAAALVDVPVHREHWLVVVNSVAHGGRSDRFHDRPAMRRPERLVECGRLVQAGAVRRGVEIEDGPLHVRDLADHRVYLFLELFLGSLAECVPRGRVGPAHRHQVEAVEVEGLGLAEGDARRGLDDVVDLPDVVVAAVED